MKIIYEAEVTTISKIGDDKFLSAITWKTGQFSSATISVGQRLGLEQKIWIIVQDFDPAVGETDALPTDEFGNELPEPESSDPESVPSQSYNSPPLDRA